MTSTSTFDDARIPVILDCDPGHDDAIMLMLAVGCGRFDIKAITVSAGNQTQDKTLNNALKVMSLTGATHIPVHRGRDKPLFRPLVIADHVHGETGLDGPEFPAPAIKPHPEPAVQAIAKILADSDTPIVIVPTGPLTNIAALLLAYPHLKSKIARISLMGGGIFRGNITPVAEFNIYVDPDAAAVVFRSGVPITMCGLDVTHQALIFQYDIERFRSIGNKAGVAAAQLMDFFSIYYRRERPELNGGAALHDPCALAWLIAPDMFVSGAYFVDVETSGELTAGATVVDFYNVLKKTPNATVVHGIDRDAYIDLLYDAITRLP